MFSKPVLIYGTILMLIGLYWYQRFAVSSFFYSVLDASEYYLAGVDAVLHAHDRGFFLLLTSSISATAFVLFGYDYAHYMLLLFYFPSVFFSYILFRQLGLTVLLSLVMTFVYMSVPLHIWLDKTSFSEPLWQTLILLLLVIGYCFVTEEKIEKTTWGVWSFLLFLLPFSRGEAVVVAGMVLMLALYRAWQYERGVRPVFGILIGGLFLFAGIYITLHIRLPYLVTYQYARILPHATATKIMQLLLVGYGMLLLLPFIVQKLKQRITYFPIASMIVILGLAFKITTVALLANKKHIPISVLLYQNEYSFMVGHFGIWLTAMIAIGMVILYLKAWEGIPLPLLLVTLYALFYLPFAMQCSPFEREHEFFLYWSRYYEAVIMMVHLFALGILLQMIYDFIVKISFNERYASFAVLGISIFIVLNIFFHPFYTIVTKESYLANSQKLFSWLQKEVGTTPLTVVYASDVKYRNYGVKQLMNKGFDIVGLHIPYYRQVHAKALHEPLKLPAKTYRTKYLLCLGQTKCSLENKQYTLISTLHTDIQWRQHNKGYNVQQMKLHAYLYQKRKSSQ